MNPKYKRCLGLVLALGLILLVICSPIIYGAIKLLYFIDYPLRKDFASIQLEASKQEVIDRLGPPAKRNTSFHLGQYEGFEEKYIKAQKSGSKYYLFWYGEIDTVYVVGFDNRDQVVFTSSGGT